MNRPVLLAAFAFLSVPALATELTFEITGVEATGGHVLVALYDEASFLRKRLKGVQLTPVQGTLAGSLGNVPEGIYALSVIHDENGNGKLDSNFIGIPKEKYGFSNNPRLYGAPKFSDARFQVSGESQVVKVGLR